MEECYICCENFNKSTRREVSCPSSDCNGKCCLACFKRNLEEGENVIPKCMFCEINLSHSFVRDTVKNTWANKNYLELRTKHLMSREKSLLPESQEDVVEELRRRKVNKEIQAIDERITVLLDEIRMLERDKMYLRQSLRQKVANKEVTTTRRCPVEECKGFLNSKWVCGICETKCCRDCGEVKEKEHECNEDTKATFKLINHDSRPCPKCGIMIHKWQGCNQMYCTQCQCMFDYRTGRLENGFFHNPHYFEALNQGLVQRREQHNVDNCNDVNVYDFGRRIRQLKFDVVSITRSEHKDIARLTDVLRIINHVQSTFERYRNDKLDEECRTMRRQYLMDELEEEEWFKKLRCVERRQEKNTETLQVLQLFVNIAKTNINNANYIVMQCLQYNKRSVNINGEDIDVCTQLNVYYDETKNIAIHCNEQLTKIAKRFNNKPKLIDVNFDKTYGAGII